MNVEITLNVGGRTDEVCSELTAVFGPAGLMGPEPSPAGTIGRH
jgi:hypothetical protein